ncbi:MAG: O-succinylhomoserine (thiol)-lyase, partial [Gammaproteobacteria bacterium]|nr:O-succinylhomoserine (thiol)-lyase [Gammaproteobacteria bacterium]
MSKPLDLSTVAVRAGLESDPATGAVVPPIHLSSTYAFPEFGVKGKYDYSRSGNPTRDLLADAIARLEGGAGAVICATGMAAISLVGAILPRGARVVAPHDCYGGTFRLFTAWAKRGDFEVEFVDFGNAQAFEAALSRPAQLLWVETPSNPLLRITDIEGVSARARRAGAKVAVDNT